MSFIIKKFPNLEIGDKGSQKLRQNNLEISTDLAKPC